jgi:hypothetical protein
MIPVTQVPKAVRSAAHFQNPGIRFHTAWVMPNGSYRLRGLDPQGATVDLVYSADGQRLTHR